MYERCYSNNINCYIVKRVIEHRLENGIYFVTQLYYLRDSIRQNHALVTLAQVLALKGTLYVTT